MRRSVAVKALALGALGGAFSLALTVSPGAAQVRFSGEAAGASVNVVSWRDLPFRTVVRQQHDFSCGSAAVATLLTYHYGRPTSEPDAFKAMFAQGDQAKITRVGFSMLDMKKYLEGRGLHADGYRMSLADLAQHGEPAIVLIDLGRYRHFVVVKGVFGGRVLVGDPALGLKIYKAQDFAKLWNGVAFTLSEPRPGRRANFNLASEWRPWSAAPIGAVMGSGAMTAALDPPPLYQISPIRALDALTAAGAP